MADAQLPSPTDPAATVSEQERRVIACLDRSSSMVRFEKYALVSALFPRAIAQLAAVSKRAWVETWWFARDVVCYAELQPAALAMGPNSLEYRRALEAGSAISDCIVRAVHRAEAIQRERGNGSTRIVVWTDGWNRLARTTSGAARETMAAYPIHEVFLVGFVDRAIRTKLDDFVTEIGLPASRVMLFEHEDNRQDTQRAAEASSRAFGETLRIWCPPA